MVNRPEHLDRALNRPQLTGIGITGGIGIGIYVTSGSLITLAGSLGGPLSYLVAGVIVACVVYTLIEMVTSRPLAGALIDLPHTFLDPAAGFAVAISYSLANIMSMAALTAHSAELTALLKDKPEKHSPGVEVGINIAFITLTTFSHCLGVKLYGKIERVIMVFKLCLYVLVCIISLIINVGGAGQRGGPHRESYRANYTSHAFPPGFVPAGFNSTYTDFIRPSGVSDVDFGLSGGGGRLFGFLTAVTLAMFSCMSGEMVAMAAGEAKEPWKDVPIVMSFVYLVPLTLNPFVLMAGAANVNYADPNLPNIWGADNGKITMSPFVVAAESSALWATAKVLDVFFIITAYTAANTALYVSSRAVFMLAQTYLPKKAADLFGRTNNGHTPLAAVLLCSAFGFISLAGLSNHAFSQPRQTMSAFYTGSLASVYVCECFTFLKFKAGLERFEKRKLLSRNDPLYISKMFRSRWQPLPAYVGIAGCVFVIVWSGIPPLYILCAKSSLTDTTHLKSNVALACDILGAWIGPLFFAAFYLGYKYIAPRSFSVDIRDLTPGDYILGDLAVIEGEDPAASHPHPNDRRLSESIQSISDHDPIERSTWRWSISSPLPAPIVPLSPSSTFALEELVTGETLSRDEQEELDARRARKEERRMINDLLEMRPSRMERALVRELFSCVIADKVK